MSIILNIETSTTVCSVAVANAGRVLASRELNDGYTHAENLHVFIDEVLKASGMAPRDLQAIAVSKGPGSYTGLRIGVSAAKGLAYALQLPLIAVETLQQMAFEAIRREGAGCYYCPMLDARRMEVYCEVFDSALQSVRPATALVIDEAGLEQLRLDQPICFLGEGMPKVRALLSTLPGSSFIDDLSPSATYMAELSYRHYMASRFENTAYFEPFYLKAFLPGS